MKIRRDLLLLVVMLLVLVLITVAASVFQSKGEQIPALSSDSNLPNGARALRLWLESMGYRANNQVGNSFAIPAGTQVVFLLEPVTSSNITTAEWKTLKTWVSDGGLLLLASRTVWFNLSSSSLPVSTTTVDGSEKIAVPAAPVFQSPPMTHPLRISPRFAFVYQRGQAVPLLNVADKSVAVDIPQGKGHIILVSDSDFLTNEGLKDPGSAELLLNLLSDQPSGSAVWFDEWHHGQRAAAEVGMGPDAWLIDTPSGRALFYCAAIIFLWLVLTGRRFGRPVPLQHDMTRRAPLEYVTALASLNRRAEHRTALMQQYRANLKRAFGRRYRLDPGLPDEEYVALLGRYKPDLDSAALLDLLQRLNRKNITEAQMVQLAREAAGWIQTIEH